MPRRSTRARRALAVVAGFSATALLSLGTDAILHATGGFPPWGQVMADHLFAWAILYRIAFTIIGGAVTAMLAPHAPMTHVFVLGVIGLIGASAGAIATWDQGPAYGRRWYPLLLIVTAIPSVWLGGPLARARGRGPAPS